MDQSSGFVSLVLVGARQSWGRRCFCVTQETPGHRRVDEPGVRGRLILGGEGLLSRVPAHSG